MRMGKACIARTSTRAQATAASPPQLLARCCCPPLWSVAAGHRQTNRRGLRRPVRPMDRGNRPTPPTTSGRSDRKRCREAKRLRPSMRSSSRAASSRHARPSSSPSSILIARSGERRSPASRPWAAMSRRERSRSSKAMATRGCARMPCTRSGRSVAPPRPSCFARRCSMKTQPSGRPPQSFWSRYRRSVSMTYLGVASMVTASGGAPGSVVDSQTRRNES